MSAARAESARLDGAIAQARHSVLVLDGEVTVRARFAELDRWNAVLRLAPPRADQYLVREADLAAYTPAAYRPL